MNNIPELKHIIQENVKEGSHLKIMTSYFTLFAYKEIQEELSKVKGVDLIINPHKCDNSGKFIEIAEENSLKLNLDYSGIAREFAQWLLEKANIKRVKSRKIEGKMLSISSSDENYDYITHSDFSATGLGILDRGGRIHINEKVEDSQRANSLRLAFDSIWNNTTQTEDIKNKIISELKNIYQDKSPELLYFFTLNHLFRDFLEDADNEAFIEKRTGITETLIWNKLYD